MPQDTSPAIRGLWSRHLAASLSIPRDARTPMSQGVSVSHGLRASMAVRWGFWQEVAPFWLWKA